jgi:2-polyprenyl-6-methoxyphenol hydroxylase-like FAD-dependent oxidoreductase
VLETLGGAELLEALLARIGHWDERLVNLIRYTDPSTVAYLKVRSSEPGAVWETGPVTVLGDAIHPMTYFRALGGNSAIYDAGLLAAELVAARRRGKPVLAALRDYEDAMRAHGYEAVRTSLSALQNNVAAGRPLKTVAAEAALTVN